MKCNQNHRVCNEPKPAIAPTFGVIIHAVLMHAAADICTTVANICATQVNIDARLIQGYDAVEGSSTIELENGRANAQPLQNNGLLYELCHTGCACCSLSDDVTFIPRNS